MPTSFSSVDSGHTSDMTSPSPKQSIPNTNSELSSLDLQSNLNERPSSCVDCGGEMKPSQRHMHVCFDVKDGEDNNSTSKIENASDNPAFCPDNPSEDGISIPSNSTANGFGSSQNGGANNRPNDDYIVTANGPGVKAPSRATEVVYMTEDIQGETNMERIKHFTRNALTICHGFSRPFSSLYSVLIISMSFMFTMSTALRQADNKPDANSTNILEKYYTVLSVLANVFLIGLCSIATFRLDYLTDDRRFRYKKYMKTTFLKAGVLIFGMGSCIFEISRIIEYFHKSSERGPDDDIISFVQPLSFIVQIAMQTYVIFAYLKLKINQSKVAQAISQLGMMHVFATNLSMWLFTLFWETKHSLDKTNCNSARHEFGQNKFSKVNELLGPYLYPCRIEYSLISAAMLFLMWTRIHSENADDDAGSMQSIHQAFGQGDGDHHIAGHRANKRQQRAKSIVGERQSHNSHVGTILGALGLALAVGILLYYVVVTGGTKTACSKEHPSTFTNQTADNNTQTKAKNGTNKKLPYNLVQGCNIFLNNAVLLVNILAVYSMRNMGNMKCLTRGTGDSRFRRHKFVERVLMTITFSGLLMYRMLTIYASIASVNDKKVHKTTLLLSTFESMAAITSGALQTGFVTFIAFSRRSIREEHYLHKPGRQCITILRFLNFALWCTATFGIKYRGTTFSYYGGVGWTILSHILKPLLILYRFHSVICLSDIARQAYTRKFLRTSSGAIHHVPMPY